MKGLVCEAVGKISLQEVSKPGIVAPTDALIRVTLTTICGSDVHLVRGHIPTEPGFIMGHEFVGRVEEVGIAVSRFKPGDRVVGPASPFCGTCDNCRAGQIQRCLNGGMLGSGRAWGDLSGTHSEFILMPFADRTLVPVPPSLKDEQVLFVGDILSTGYYGVCKAGLCPGESVVVLGAGPVGLCAVHAATLFGPRNIIAVDLIEHRLQLARDMGATHVIDATKGDVVQQVLEYTNGGPEVVIEAAGAPVTIQQAVDMIRIGGRIMVVGLPTRHVEFSLPAMIMKNVSLFTGLAYLGNMERLVRLIEAGKLDTTPLISHRMRLSEIVQGFKMFAAQQNNVVKIAVTP